MRHVYLAATGQNRGKTTVSLGVLDGFQRRGLSAAFLKPVGQRTIIEDGVPADEDAVLGDFERALEDDDPAILVKMVQRLRAAEVRKYTALDTPIFLGLKMPVEDAISAAL